MADYAEDTSSWEDCCWRVRQRVCQGLCVVYVGNAATRKVLRPVGGFARVIELHFTTGGDTVVPGRVQGVEARGLGVSQCNRIWSEGGGVEAPGAERVTSVRPRRGGCEWPGARSVRR